MFKGLAGLGAGRRQMLPEATPAHFNDNRPDHRLAAVSRRARPQGLTCHWRATAAGGLECHWQIEPLDEGSAEAPGQSCTTRHMHDLLGLALRGKPAIRVRQGSRTNMRNAAPTA
jgi:hypothetical protein